MTDELLSKKIKEKIDLERIIDRYQILKKRIENCERDIITVKAVIQEDELGNSTKFTVGANMGFTKKDLQLDLQTNSISLGEMLLVVLEEEIEKSKKEMREL